MKSISASSLSHLLEGGFQGIVQFDGRVFARINLADSQQSFGFYEADGRFVLSALDSGIGRYNLKLNGSYFSFEKKKGANIGYSDDDKYGPVIMVPIAQPERACLQIEPTYILF